LKEAKERRKEIINDKDLHTKKRKGIEFFMILNKLERKKKKIKKKG